MSEGGWVGGVRPPPSPPPQGDAELLSKTLAEPQGSLQACMRKIAQNQLGYLWTLSPVSTLSPPTSALDLGGVSSIQKSAVPSALSSYMTEPRDMGNTRCVRLIIVRR